MRIQSWMRIVVVPTPTAHPRALILIHRRAPEIRQRKILTLGPWVFMRIFDQPPYSSHSPCPTVIKPIIEVRFCQVCRSRFCVAQATPMPSAPQLRISRCFRRGHRHLSRPTVAYFRSEVAAAAMARKLQTSTCPNCGSGMIATQNYLRLESYC